MIGEAKFQKDELRVQNELSEKTEQEARDRTGVVSRHGASGVSL